MRHVSCCWCGIEYDDDSPDHSGNEPSLLCFRNRVDSLETQLKQVTQEHEEVEETLSADLQAMADHVEQVTQERNRLEQACNGLDDQNGVLGQISKSLREELKQEEKMREECRYWKDYWKSSYDKIHKLWNEALESSKNEKFNKVLKEFIDKQQYIPPKFIQIINDKFWNLLAGTDESSRKVK